MLELKEKILELEKEIEEYQKSYEFLLERFFKIRGGRDKIIKELEEGNYEEALKIARFESIFK